MSPEKNMKKHSKKKEVFPEKSYQDPEDPIIDLFRDDFAGLNSSRRNFLKILGYSFASAAVLAACKRPVRKAIPYAVQPPELVPRKPLYYASTYSDGHDYCSIIVKTIDGRPIKIEGNALSPFNGEGTTARIQASVLSLYDDTRHKGPALNGTAISWDELDQQLTKDLAGVKGDVVLLTPTIISPSTTTLINSFGSGFRNFRWVQYDPISYSALTSANETCFGRAVFPDYQFDKADVVVAVNCDFLGTWGTPVHFIPGYVSRRKLTEGQRDMLYHVQYESGMTLTGSNADRRIKIRPSEEKLLLANLYNIIAGKTGNETVKTGTFREDLSGLADRLLASKGRSVVLSGTNDTDVQILTNAINNLLGNFGNTIDLANPLRIAAGRDSEMTGLVNDMSKGSIGALFMYGVNPAYDYPEKQEFLEALGRIPITVNMPVFLNETSGRTKYECPVNHYLESWDDAEIIPGQLSLVQPCINPIFNTRQFQESLLKWSGSSQGWHDYLASAWQTEYFPASGMGVFREFWNKSLSDGVFSYRSPENTPVSFNAGALANVAMQEPAAEGFEIILAENVAMGTGAHANNPWLMELPDPVTRQCWENVASFSPKDASDLGIVNGQLVKIGNDITIPAYIQPGQAEQTISVALGYGHDNHGPVANGNGVNVYNLARYSGGVRKYSFTGTAVTATGEIRQLALMQLHDSQEGRPLARETTLTKYLEDPASGNHLHFEFETLHKSLYPDYPFDGFHWSIAIDLNACIGCNTCVIACQAENNTPTVGRDEVSRNRIMHWIKVHRYYSGDPDDPEVIFQPVFCQQCDDAPCENVCPVSATTHSNEGLNQMTYNRCVGTKYCMNNCPYRVRRFNWFRYTGNKEFDYNAASELGKMVLNPDVTVRERGVVEKCTFCAQRIQAAKLRAKLEGRVLTDMEIKPACMQACPAGAIIFGDTNNKGSRVSQLFNDKRRYGLLEQLHTLPSVGFLTKVRNDRG
jgi:Fe-S-cluster-containing dehydrogenase component